MEPYVVERMKNVDGEVVYQSQPMLSSTVINAQAAEEMKELMRETVTSGTSRGSFRGFKRSAYGFVDVGGKTGSLSGNDPEGKYDWFVGYGASGEHRLAVAALVISKEYWKVKSSFLARKAIEFYFKEKFGVQTIGTNRRIAGRSIALSDAPVERKRKHRRVRRVRHRR
jgi:cell division protein FtsI/penicillin-binding protein 2